MESCGCDAVDEEKRRPRKRKSISAPVKSLATRNRAFFYQTEYLSLVKNSHEHHFWFEMLCWSIKKRQWPFYVQRREGARFKLDVKDREWDLPFCEFYFMIKKWIKPHHMEVLQRPNMKRLMVSFTKGGMHEAITQFDIHTPMNNDYEYQDALFSLKGFSGSLAEEKTLHSEMVRGWGRDLVAQSLREHLILALFIMLETEGEFCYLTDRSTHHQGALCIPNCSSRDELIQLVYDEIILPYNLSNCFSFSFQPNRPAVTFHPQYWK